MPNKNFISISQAARILKVSPDTLRNWEKQGKLIPNRTAGGARRYRLSLLGQLTKELNPQKKRYGMLTVTKAAKHLGISADTLRAWDKKGLISADRTDGGARRFDKAEILKLRDQMGDRGSENHSIRESDSEDGGRKTEVGKNPGASNSEAIVISSELDKSLNSNLNSTPKSYLSLIPTIGILFLLVGFFAFLWFNQTSLITPNIPNLPKNLGNQNGPDQAVIDGINDKIYKLSSSLEYLQNEAQQQTTQLVNQPTSQTLQKGQQYIDLIGKTIIDSFGNIYPSNEAQAGAPEVIKLPQLGLIDKKFYGLYLNNFDVNSNGDMFVHGNSTLGDSGTKLTIAASLASDLVPTDSNSLKLGSDSKYFNEGFIKTISGTSANYTQFSGQNLTLSNAGTLDLASTTAGNTFNLKVPNLASGTCTSGVAEGLIFKDQAGTQLGHACIDSGTPKLKFYAESFNASSTDLAENYSDRANVLTAGDLVQIDQKQPKGIKKAESTSKVLGVISDQPGLKLTGIGENGQTDLVNPKPVALAGRVYTKVSNENGPIQIGDYLTASSVPGVAMKATSPGMVVGQALEDHDSLDSYKIAKVLTFINLSFGDPQNLLANLSLDQDGSLIVSKIKTGSITISNSLATNLKPSDQKLAIDNLTKVGELASSSETSNSQNFLAFVTQLEVIKNDVASNSATLANHQNQIEELDQKLSKSDLLLKDLAEKLAKSASESGLQKEIATANPNTPSTPNLTPLDTILASNSAEINKSNISNNISALAISDVFKSLGDTFLGKTNLAGDLTVDGTFSVSQDSINVIGVDCKSTIEQCNNENNGILHLQNSPLAQGLDIFNGLVTIDKLGNIKAPSVTVAEFKVYANKTSGTSKIPKGEKSVFINNLLVSQNSRILITPTSDSQVVLGVTEKSDGKGFQVSATKPLDESDLTFDWFLVQEVD